MPTDYRLRLDDFERVEHARAEAIEPGKDQTVNIAERHTFRPLALQHIQLMPEHKDLGCLAARDRNSPTKAHQNSCKDHSSLASINRFAVARQSFWVSDRDRTVLVTFLCEGQAATVLQLPARPMTAAEEDAQKRVTYVG